MEVVWTEPSGMVRTEAHPLTKTLRNDIGDLCDELRVLDDFSCFCVIRVGFASVEFICVCA